MNISVQHCSSCAIFANACARNAIFMQFDAKDICHRVFDAEKCIRTSVLQNIVYYCNLFKNVADKVTLCDSNDVKVFVVASLYSLFQQTLSQMRRFFCRLGKISIKQLIKMYYSFSSSLKWVYVRERGYLGWIKQKIVGQGVKFLEVLPEFFFEQSLLICAKR